MLTSNWLAFARLLYIEAELRWPEAACENMPLACPLVGHWFIAVAVALRCID